MTTWAQRHGTPPVAKAYFMRMIPTLLAIGAGAYVFKRLTATGSQNHVRAAFADDQPDHGLNPVRDAGPEAMRDPPRGTWTAVDEASDQSFPASDPPSTY